MNDNISPIILLGSGRNGTTMLCNIITQHEDVSSIQHELHWGFHESNIYENCMYWGNFNTLDDYIEFLEVYSSMDTFTISGLKKEDFYKEDYPKNFLEFYLDMMDAYVKESNTKYWLTKIDPLYYSNKKELNNFINILNSRYKNIKYVSIQRNIYDVLRSYLKMEGTYQNLRNTSIGKPFALLLGIIRYTIHYRETDKLLNLYKGISFKYELFLSNQEDYKKKLFNYLNINYNKPFSKEKYKANSSFHENEKKENSKFLNLSIMFVHFLVKNTPYFSNLFLKLYEKIKPNRRPDFWRLKKEKYFYNQYKNELTTTSQFQLLEILESRKTTNK